MMTLYICNRSTRPSKSDMIFTYRICLVSINCLLPVFLLIRIFYIPIWVFAGRVKWTDERIWIGCRVLNDTVNDKRVWSGQKSSERLLFSLNNADTMIFFTLLSFLYCYTYCLIHAIQFIVQVCVIHFYLHVPLQMVWKMRCNIISTNTKVA